MPSVRIWGNPLPAETKEALGRRMCIDLKRVLKVPIGEVYFNDCDAFYVDDKNGFSIYDKARTSGYVTLIVNGPVREQSVLAELCAALTESFRDVANIPDCEVSFVYHPIDGDHIGSNGQLHSLRKPKPADEGLQ